METSLTKVLLLLLACAPAAAYAASVGGGLDVVVKGRSGQVAYKGKTDANGNFASSSLSPGDYVLEFHAAKPLKGQLSVAATGGKSTMQATDVPGEKFAKGGVAMNVAVGKAGKLTGAVVAAGQKAVASGEKMEKVRANVKEMNGKRYVWVPAPIGSNMGGKWVEEGTEGAVLSTSNSKGGDGEMLQKINDQAANVGRR